MSWLNMPGVVGQPLPPPPTNILHIAQGTLSADNGQPTENTTRVYTVEPIPITNSEFDIVKPLGGYWFVGRCYNSIDNYINYIDQYVSSDKIYFKNADEHSKTWGIGDTCTIVVGSQKVASVKSIRLAFRTELGTDDITPSMLDGKTLTVDGVTYTLVAQRSGINLPDYVKNAESGDYQVLSFADDSSRVYCIYLSAENQGFGDSSPYTYGGAWIWGPITRNHSMKIFVSTNGGTTWTEIFSGNSPASLKSNTATWFGEYTFNASQQLTLGDKVHIN